MARPLRFRCASGRWDADRVRDEVADPLDANLGVERRRPWFRSPEGYSARRFDVDNGDTALICWNDDGAYWLGNTETPPALWRTDKFGFDEVPAAVAAWAERELLAELHDEEPWLDPYPTVARFFLPVLCSKDGRETTRRFLRDHAAGFPDADRDEALAFYEEFLEGGTLDDHREVMAGKLGTSERVDLPRMRAAMGEFNAAKVLDDAGHGLTPEASVSGGYSLDYRTDDGTLVEVTRPVAPDRRSAGGPVAAIRETAGSKLDGQLDGRGGEVALFVDCTSFPDDDWQRLLAERAPVGHRPAVVYRVRPSGRVEGYVVGTPSLGVERTIAETGGRTA
ncbi:MAG: DUF5784 family protein [Haloferacaceae archaeon]